MDKMLHPSASALLQARQDLVSVYQALNQPQNARKVQALLNNTPMPGKTLASK